MFEKNATIRLNKTGKLKAFTCFKINIFCLAFSTKIFLFLNENKKKIQR